MTGAQRAFNIHASAWAAVNAFLFVVDVATGDGLWFFYPLGGWGIGLALHATVLYTKAPEDDELEPGDERQQLGYRS